MLTYEFVQYIDEIYSLQNLLSRTQAGPGRTLKQEQEEISPNHTQVLFPGPVHVQRGDLIFADLVKQDPGRARQNT